MSRPAPQERLSMIRASLVALAFALALAALGCEKAAVPGKVKIESTNAFGKMKGVKSPPPKAPTAS